MSDATPPSAKRRRLDFSENVKVLIGPNKEEVFVPKSILTKSSEFFKACCDGHNWKESVTKTVELPEDDLDTFSAYLQFLFTGELVVTEEALTPETSNRELEKRKSLFDEDLRPLCKLAVLADKMSDATLSNAVVDSIIVVSDACCIVPGAGHIKELYPRLPQSSPTRAMLRDMYASCKQGDDLEDEATVMPTDFTRELMVQLLRAQGQKKEEPPEYKDRCKYHIHNDKVPKCT